MSEALLWLSIGVPAAGALLAVMVPPLARPLGVLAAFATTGVAVAISLTVHDAQAPVTGGVALTYLLLHLQADGLSAVLMLMNAAVGVAVSVYAGGTLSAAIQRRFWPLWMLLWAALNTLLLATNLMLIYLALEIVGLIAAGLVALSPGRAAALAALRYLFASAAGSLTMLMGAALLFGAHGALELSVLAQRIEADTASFAGVALIIAGLVIKSALFPLHFWLPPFHAEAPAPVSALHSALVVKASFYVLLRLWVDVFDPLPLDGVAVLLGTLGALAILWGATHALRAERLKRVVAYSTVAQIGYLFIAFPLLRGSGAELALPAVAYFVLAHALAKSAMFMAAGNIRRALGHDRLVDMQGVSSRLPTPVLVFALAGASIIGLPPSGGFAAKWLLLQGALADPATMPWAAVMLVGSLLSAAYVFRVLYYTFAAQTDLEVPHPLASAMRWPPLLLALVVILMGFFSMLPLTLLAVGGGA